MTNKITVFFGIAVMAAVLVGGLIYTQSAFATMEYVTCSTDKDNPTTGADLSGNGINIANPGDDCYLGQYGVTTIVYGINIVDAGTVNIVNTEIGFGSTYISGTTDKLKFKDNVLHGYADLSYNTVSHLEVMDNYDFAGPYMPTITIYGNDVNLFKVVGNSIDVIIDANTVDFFAFCKNNTPEAVTLWGNTYENKNKGCPEIPTIPDF